MATDPGIEQEAAHRVLPGAHGEDEQERVRLARGGPRRVTPRSELQLGSRCSAWDCLELTDIVYTSADVKAPLRIERQLPLFANATAFMTPKRIHTEVNGLTAWIANLTFGLITATVANVNRAWLQLVIWGMNFGLVGFVIGLSTDSAAIEQVSAPVMGWAILFGIWLLLSALRADESEPVTMASSVDLCRECAVVLNGSRRIGLLPLGICLDRCCAWPPARVRSCP
jgi:hypothetical protein